MGALDAWRHDLAQAARGLRRRPLNTAASLLTLALAVGATTVVFTLVHAVLLRPLPYPEPDELVTLGERHEGRQRMASPAGYLEWRRDASSFDGVAAWDPTVFVVGEERPERVPGAWVSGNLPAVLGVAPVVGPGLDPTLRLDASAVRVLLSHDLWIERFGGDPGVVGRSVTVDDRALPVAGVMPAGFDFPEGARLWLRSPWEAPPVGELGEAVATTRDAWYVRVVGRLTDGATLASATDEMAALDRRVREAHPEAAPDGGTLLRPLHDETVASARPLLGLLSAAVILVLLTACANVAGLGLASMEERRRELAVRRALGAGRWRLARLLASECLLLAAAGGALGLGLALLGLPAARTLLPGRLPRLDGVAVDGTVVIAALAATTAAALATGLLPALRASDAAGSRSLRSRDGSTGTGWTRDALVAAEVAGAVVLVAGAVLLLRSLSSVASVDPGFEADGLATTWVTLPASAGPTERAAVVESARRVGGVRDAALASGPPTEVGPRATLRVEGQAGFEDGPDVEWKPVDPGWRDVVGVALVAGRALAPTDVAGGRDVAVLSRSAARAAFGAGDPLGRRVTIGLDGHDRPLTVVGVAEDVRNRGPAAEPHPVLYRPVAQTRAPWSTWSVAARLEPGVGGGAVVALRDALSRGHPDAVVYGATTGGALLASWSGDRRFVLRVLAAFAALALLLGGVGVYGVAASAVARRRREIGVRIAVGAGPGRVAALVVGRGMRPVGAGLLAGALLALAGGRLLDGLLHGVEPGDPLSLAVVAGVLGAVAAAALAAPTLRAVSVDPAVALRGD